jgi:hypothetical protein
LYVAPRPDILTILCPKQEPTVIVIEGTGRLGLHSNCKAYGTRVFIQAQVVLSTNNSEKDIIPPLSLDYDCCEFMGKDFKLKNINLELPLKNVVNRLDDLRLASHKADEVNKLIQEQEWKIKHSASYSHSSLLSYVSLSRELLCLFFVTAVVAGVAKEHVLNFLDGGRIITRVPLL